MGYYSTTRGFVEFENPITNPQLLKILRSKYATVHYLCGLDPDGVGDHPYGGEGKAYRLEDEIRELFSVYPGRGWIAVYGEDSTDIWRLVLDGSKVTHEEAEIRWPDGTLVDSNY